MHVTSLPRLIGYLAAGFLFTIPSARAVGPLEKEVRLRPIGRLDTSRRTSPVPQAIRGDLREYPRDAELLKQAGLALHREGRPRAAIDLYQRAITMSPGDLQLRYYLAHAYTLVYDPRALAEATAVVRADASFAEARALRGILLRRVGRDEEGLAELQQAWLASPPSVAAGRELARWELDRDRPRVAATILEVCAIHQPKSTAILQSLAEAHEKAGNLRDARMVWMRLVERGEGGANALAKLHESSGPTTINSPFGSQAEQTYLSDAKRIDPFLAVSRETGVTSGRSRLAEDFEFPSLTLQTR